MMIRYATASSGIAACAALVLASGVLMLPSYAQDATGTVITDSKAIEDSLSKEAFPSWLDELKKEVLRKGIKLSTWQAVEPYLIVNQEVLTLDQQQPEFTQTFWTYLDKRMTEIRIQTGKIQFGSLVLSGEKHPRRSSFFRKELIAAITIIDQGHTTPDDMKGSWAGAVGQMQFMPSIFLRYAQDADGDKKINLWNSTEDALTSAAVFLQSVGWQAGVAWGQEVTLPKKFDYALADGQTPRTIPELEALGIKPTIKLWRNPQQEVLIWTPAGHTGPAFVTYSNFQIIKKWNRSNHYAFTVGLMADRMVNNYRLSIATPDNIKPWPKDFTRQLQQRLLDLGYDIGKVDGWLGQNTIRAIRSFQQEKGLIADGYPDADTLKHLQLSD